MSREFVLCVVFSATQRQRLVGLDRLERNRRQGFAHPQIADVPIAAITEKPRKYGFHGTLKAPFRLAEGVRESDLVTEATGLVSSKPAFEMPALQITRLGSFLAFIPQQPSAELQQLASSLVRELDTLRAPLNDAELVRRRSAGLTPAQEMLLTKWGYPYVMDEFRFHLTLSGKLQATELQSLKSILQNHTSHLTQTPVTSMMLAWSERQRTGAFISFAAFL